MCQIRSRCSSLGNRSAEKAELQAGHRARPALVVAAIGVCVLLSSAAALHAQAGQGGQGGQRGSTVPATTPLAPPLVLAHPDGAAGPPVTLTLADALSRARQNDAQFQAVRSDAELARDDRIQARAATLPALSATTQFLGNSANGVNPNGRFVSLEIGRAHV